MILKEKETIISENHRINMGNQAEKQMAFYLSRNFAKDTNCFVINDLRIVHDNAAAQIDHLIVTQYGLFIIESKSVHGQISINKNSEWSRSYHNKIIGIPSPVLQAEEQGKLLKSLLNQNRHVLLSKLLGALQKGFGCCPINIYVAVSDTGIINREVNIPELLKADQVCNSIKEKIKHSKKISSLISLSMEVGWMMSESETKTVCDFLLSQHRPLTKNTKNSAQNSSEVTQLAVENISSMFTPKEGICCPVCHEFKLVKKSIQRSSGTTTEFLACENYPKSCNTIYPIKDKNKEVNEFGTLKVDDICPRCNSGSIVERKKVTVFLACSRYPKCKFTSYR